MILLGTLLNVFIKGKAHQEFGEIVVVTIVVEMCVTIVVEV